MSTALMPRDEALVKLLRLEPLEPLYARQICGWPVQEFQSIVAQLEQAGRVRWVRHDCSALTRLAAA